MAVRIGFHSATTFGQSGSFYGSEVVLNVPVGPLYLSANTVTVFGINLPSWLQIVLPPGGAADVQYSPDSQVTWYSCRQGTGTLIFADTAGSFRLFGAQAAGTIDARVVPIRQA